MINTTLSGSVLSYEAFKEETCLDVPETERAEVSRITKLLQTMQHQGQFYEIELIYQTLRAMADPKEDGDLYLAMDNLLRIMKAGERGNVSLVKAILRRFAKGLSIVM